MRNYLHHNGHHQVDWLEGEVILTNFPAVVSLPIIKIESSRMSGLKDSFGSGSGRVTITVPATFRPYVFYETLINLFFGVYCIGLVSKTHYSTTKLNICVGAVRTLRSDETYLHCRLTPQFIFLRV